MTEEPIPTYRALFVTGAIERAPIGTRGLFVERAGNTVSVCAKTGCGIEVILVLDLDEAEALGSFLSVTSCQTAKSPLARAF